MHKSIFSKIIAITFFIGNYNLAYTQFSTSKQVYPTLHYVSVDSLGIDSTFLYSKIDSIVDIGIIKEAFPGCQVLAAKDGAIFFHKVYGYHTYDKNNPTKKNDLYDWASITKITGTLPAIMKLYDEGKLNLDTPYSVYWKQFRNSNKKSITLREILAHRAGLYPWIAFWQSAYTWNKRLKRSVIRPNPSKKFRTQIAENMYVNEKFKKKIYRKIKRSKLYEKKEYIYSGLAFFTFPKLIENITGEDYEEYIKSNFYRPLGAKTITYNPLRYFPKSQIIPTELDQYFRYQQLRGYVHDEGAAMMAGVSGNAGLFGTTLDLAKMMQMYLNGGAYGNKRFISDSTLNLFTSYQYMNDNPRRGLGFDKPLVKNKDKGYISINASELSFGHSGYTGTFTWADPKTGILIIFMSNRVFPSRHHIQLYRLNIRQSIHQVVCDAVENANSLQKITYEQ